MEVRVRFAPSPTGFLHLGGVRTALFNWLFARHEGGKFLLRIEDTDKERSEKRFEEDIIQNLEWLGVMPDEPIIRQSERIDVYEKNLKKLIDEHKAYYCFCSSEELEEEYRAQLSQGIIPKYSGKCKSLSADEVSEKLKTSSAVIRFKMPEETISFTDMIRGKVEFDTKLFGDIIIAKGLREPLYNFAVVIDDAEQKVTHVIRGEEHLSNTPKQMVLQEAFGFPSVTYAHLPLILGADKKKLSKRFLTNSLNDYKNQGYLPNALLNFLVLLGWHPKEDREVLTILEMINEFSIKRVQKAGAVFNPEKLDWLNFMHIRAMDVDELAKNLIPFVPAEWQQNEMKFKRAVEISKDRLKNLCDFQKDSSFIFTMPEYDAAIIPWKNAPTERVIKNVTQIRSLIEKGDNAHFPDEAIKNDILSFAEKEGRGDVLWPLRVALSGMGNSPGPMELLYVLGRKESIERIEIALHKLSDTSQ